MKNAANPRPKFLARSNGRGHLHGAESCTNPASIAWRMSAAVWESFASVAVPAVLTYVAFDLTMQIQNAT
jgi:hypothetical protein